MNTRLASTLKIHAGEASLVLMLGCIMLLAAAVSALGGASIDALFFANYGVQNLPFWYVVLGLVTFLNLVLMAGLAGRVARSRLYLYLPPSLAGLLLLGWGLLSLKLPAVYPLLFVGKEVINALQGVFLWGLAGALLDARQARRLFPLLTAGVIAGSMSGAFGTPVLVGAFGAQNMLLAWSLALLAAGLLVRRLVLRHTELLGKSSPTSAPATEQKKPGVIASLWDEIQTGYRFVRRSSLLSWFALTSLLFSVLWFSLALPFSRQATFHYPNANDLASFFGLFEGIWNSAALLISLFLSSRLLGRFGLMNVLIAYPIIYFSAFALLAAFPFFPLVVLFRFLQITWGQSAAETAWQASFNVVPAERRDQARAFINVSGQVGIILVGVVLMIGEKTLTPLQLSGIGLISAALLFYVLLRARRAYKASLLDALRSGLPQVFYTDEEPFGGFIKDPTARQVLLDGLAGPDPARRRLSAEILAHFPEPAVAQALQDGLNDTEPSVRAACLASLNQVYAHAQPTPSLLLDAVTACLGDPHPAVRSQAVLLLSSHTPSDPSILEALRPLLEDDDTAVRAQVAAALLQTEKSTQGLQVLSNLIGDANPLNRQQALDALAVLEDIPPEVYPALLQSLGDADPAVQVSAAAILARMEESCLPDVLQALQDPNLESAALRTLEELPGPLPQPELHAYLTRTVSQAAADHALACAFPTSGDEPASLLVESFHRRARQHAFTALRAFGLINSRSQAASGRRQAADLAMQALQGGQASQVAYALESLETLDENGLLRPLLPLWENTPPPASQAITPAAALQHALDDGDPWLRACAALAARHSDDPQITSRLQELAHSDPHPLVRGAAASALGEQNMETLATLSTFERILFLRKVPLFADLPPQDLQQVAVVMQERIFPDGFKFAQQDEPGSELFIIASGAVQVITAAGAQLAVRGVGEFVGEMSLLVQAPRMASLVAQGDLRLLCVGQKEFNAILRQRPEISLAIITVLCQRLRQQVG